MGQILRPYLYLICTRAGILEKADGNKENRALGWLGAALLCKGEPIPLPLWASMHVGMSGLLV